MYAYSLKKNSKRIQQFKAVSDYFESYILFKFLSTQCLVFTWVIKKIYELRGFITYLCVYFLDCINHACLGLGEGQDVSVCMCGHVCYSCCSFATLCNISSFPILETKDRLREAHVLPQGHKHLKDLYLGFTETTGRPSANFPLGTRVTDRRWGHGGTGGGRLSRARMAKSKLRRAMSFPKAM